MSYSTPSQDPFPGMGCFALFLLLTGSFTGIFVYFTILTFWF